MPADPFESPVGQPAAAAGLHALSNASRRGHLSIAKQVEAIGELDPEALQHNPVANWPKLELRGKQYVLDDWLVKKRPRRSWIGDHGWFLIEVTADGELGENTAWCCNYCNKVFAAAATSSAANHLSLKHDRHDETKEPSAKRRKRSSVLDLQRAAAAESGSSPPAPAQPLPPPPPPPPQPPQPTADQVRKLLAAWVVNSNLPFSTVEDRHFHKLLQLLNPQVYESLLPLTGDSLRNWVVAQLHGEKEAPSARTLPQPEPQGQVEEHGSWADGEHDEESAVFMLRDGRVG